MKLNKKSTNSFHTVKHSNDFCLLFWLQMFDTRHLPVVRLVYQDGEMCGPQTVPTPGLKDTA
jgi:hypothetical protein